MDLNFLWKHLEHIQGQIERADNKINLLLVVHLALVPFAVALIYRVVLEKPSCILKFPVCCLFSVFIIAALFFFWFEWNFVQMFRKTVSPRVNAQSYLNDKEYKSIVFWNHIADRRKFESFDAFNREYKEEQVKRDIMEQIYVNSHIAKEKFDYVRKAYRNLKFSVIFLLFMGISALFYLLMCEPLQPKAGL